MGSEQQTKKWGVKSKIWLEVDGQPVIGEGRMAMLQAIHRHGSMIQASRETGIAYRKIRGAIRNMEDILGQRMVEVFRGGQDRGGARLTPEAYNLLESYTQLTQSMRDEMDARVQELLG